MNVGALWHAVLIFDLAHFSSSRQLRKLLHCWFVHLALTNLDNGLFFSGSGWVPDHGRAMTFRTKEEACQKAIEQNVRNAAAAMMSGFPQTPVGFIWLTNPGQSRAHSLPFGRF